MELWQAAVNAGVGMIVMSVTELLKKWGGINYPLAKLIIVLILSSCGTGATGDDCCSRGRRDKDC